MHDTLKSLITTAQSATVRHHGYAYAEIAGRQVRVRWQDKDDPQHVRSPRFKRGAHFFVNNAGPMRLAEAEKVLWCPNEQENDARHDHVRA